MTNQQNHCKTILEFLLRLGLSEVAKDRHKSQTEIHTTDRDNRDLCMALALAHTASQGVPSQGSSAGVGAGLVGRLAQKRVLMDS